MVNIIVIQYKNPYKLFKTERGENNCLTSA